VRVKSYGKLSFFWSDQAGAGGYSQDELDALLESVLELEERREGAARDEKHLRAELQNLEMQPDDDVLIRYKLVILTTSMNSGIMHLNTPCSNIESLRAEMTTKTRRLMSISAGGQVALDPQAMKRATDELDFFVGCWRRRKKQCLETVELLSEQMELKTRDAFALFGVETDIDADAVLPNLLKR
jgi:hypothetical protein